jgi:hypothetical protein
MQPNRKARREHQRRAIKNHAKELEERQRGTRKKVPRKLSIPVQPKGVSFFDIQYDRVIGTAINGIGWLWFAGSTLLKFIMVAFTVLITSFSGTEVRAVGRKPVSGTRIDDMTISQTEEADSDVSGCDKESTSEEVGIQNSLPSYEQFCASS